MTIVWDDANDGTVYDHNGDKIGLLDPKKRLRYPQDLQKIVNEAYKKSDSDTYRENLLLQKLDLDIKRTSNEIQE